MPSDPEKGDTRGETPEPPPKEFRRLNPDADFFRSYAVGCGVLLLAFLLLWALVTLFWLR